MQKIKKNYTVKITKRISFKVANTSESGSSYVIDEENLRLLKEEADPILCTDDEVNQLLEEMQITIKEVEESEYYLNMVQLLHNNQEIRKNMLRVLGGSSSGGGDCKDRLQMVIYGLVSIQFNFKAQYQLSMAILLRRDFSHWIGGIIEIFDPCTTPVDAKVMKTLGCTVPTNEGGCRRVKKRPTLFFMPTADYEHVGSLLEANWCPSRLNKMVVFTSSFKFQAEKMKLLRTKFYGDEKRYLIKTILEHTIEVDCRRVDFLSEWFKREAYIRLRQPFHSTNWHFFNLLSDDVHPLEALLPETKLETMRKTRDGKEDDDILKLEYPTYLHYFRFDKKKTSLETNYPECKDWSELLYKNRLPGLPSKRKWCSPSTDWIKLNFSAAAGNYQGGSRAIVLGYGGIFHNENKECLISYSCPLLEDQEVEAAADDFDFANAEALRKGLRLFTDLRSSTTTMNTKKLIIEGDSVSIVRWANCLFPPPKRLVEVFKEIHDLMSCITTCLVFHIHKEANSMAIELANEGAITGLSKLHRICISAMPSWTS